MWKIKVTEEKAKNINEVKNQYELLEQEQEKMNFKEDEILELRKEKKELRGSLDVIHAKHVKVATCNKILNDTLNDSNRREKNVEVAREKEIKKKDEIVKRHENSDTM